MERKALVYYRSDLAGYLSETDDGYHFLYDTQYLNMKDAKPISLTLPIQMESFESKALFSFFDDGMDGRRGECAAV